MNIITLSNTAIAKPEGAKEEFYKYKSKEKEYDLFLLEKIWWWVERFLGCLQKEVATLQKNLGRPGKIKTHLLFWALGAVYGLWKHNPLIETGLLFNFLQGEKVIV